MKGIILASGSGTSALSFDFGCFQTAHAGLRQTDDLLSVERLVFAGIKEILLISTPRDLPHSIPATRIYVLVGATDMRKGDNGLYGLVRDKLGLEVRNATSLNKGFCCSLG